MPASGRIWGPVPPDVARPSIAGPPVTEATPLLSPDSAASAEASAAPADRVLIHRLASRDPEALAALYDRHIGAVFSLAARIVEDSDEAGRVVHEVFDQAWSDVESYDGGRLSVGRWLLEMTRARAIARLRERETAAREAPATAAAAEAEAPATAAVEAEAPATAAAEAEEPATAAVEAEAPTATEAEAPATAAAEAEEPATAAAEAEAPATAAAEAVVADAIAAESGAATLRLPSPAQGSAYDVYGPERADSVRAALAGLPLLQRLGIELAYYEGLTLSQIAGRLEQPPETINARIRSGLEHIRTALEDPGE